MEAILALLPSFSRGDSAYCCQGYFFAKWGVADVMRIIKKINTSAVLALDSSGKEIVVLGKGLGFPAIPYELEDLSRIDRTFYDVDSRYLGMITDIPQQVLLASAEIAELAEDELDCRMNPNLPFTLADHLHFAISRLRSGVDLTTPIAYDVKHLYPREYDLGVRALEILRNTADVMLPEHEAVNVTMHIINAEAESSDLHNLMMTLKIIDQVENLAERQMRITLDKESYYYSRFAMHLRYLIQRLENGNPAEAHGAEMLRPIAREYPEIYACALKVAEYFKGTWGWQCSDEEIVYLMVHIHRVWKRTQ